MATTSLKLQSSNSFETSSCETQMDSDKDSVHWQFPLRTDALLDLTIVLPVCSETTDTNSLSQPLGTYKDTSSKKGKKKNSIMISSGQINISIYRKRKGGTGFQYRIKQQSALTDNSLTESTYQG